MDSDTLRAEFDPETFETNVPGVYLAGSVVGGRMNGEVFIENGRFHGEVGGEGDREFQGQFGDG